MATLPVASDALDRWLADDGPLARKLRGFEARPQQREMAAAVAQAFAAPEHLAVEAGTGVGKTFAYLLPALDQVLRHQRRVIISTHTIALQEQLVQKDLPLLVEALEAPVRFELVKGRHNYLGLRRLQQASNRQRALFADATRLGTLHAIEDWAYRTGDGSLSDLSETPPLDVWEKVRSEHTNCMGRRCATYETCFYQRARRRAEQADILIVNHALLLSDLILRRDGASVLPDHDLVIVDEAHTLDAVASDHFGTTVSSSQIQFLLNGLYNDRTGKGWLAETGAPDQRDAVIAAARACNTFFDNLAAWQRGNGRSNGRLIREGVIENTLSPALDEMVGLVTPLKERLPRLEDQFELGSMLQKAADLSASVGALLRQQFADHVYWIETDAQHARRVSLCAAPLDPGPALRTLLFDRVPSVVLTSATLADAEDEQFEFLRNRLGAPPARTLRLGSPFRYDEQVTVYVEAGMPDPAATDRFTDAASRAITHYLRMTEGRAFVLFTSYGMLGTVARLVRDDLRAEGYTILAQGEDLPRSMLLQRFRETPRAALFGTDSFWQGVDVAGEALSNVIIVKLPFVVPDRPTVEARIDLIRRRGGNPFNAFQVPDAILKLRQGFGRLIRSQSDRGIVVLLDPRVVTKGYGKRFLRSLPGGKIVVNQNGW